MGLFDKLTGKKAAVDWSDAYCAAPRFYEKSGVSPFGVMVLTEDTKTVLPRNPQLDYQVDGKTVAEWKLMLFSISKDSVIGAVDYFAALKKLEPYSLDKNETAILIPGLSLAELEGITE